MLPCCSIVCASALLCSRPAGVLELNRATPWPDRERTALESPTFATMSFWPSSTAVTAVQPSSLPVPASAVVR